MDAKNLAFVSIVTRGQVHHRHEEPLSEQISTIARVMHTQQTVTMSAGLFEKAAWHGPFACELGLTHTKASPESRGGSSLCATQVCASLSGAGRLFSISCTDR